jgi:hypothetical protein
MGSGLTVFFDQFMTLSYASVPGPWPDDSY